MEIKKVANEKTPKAQKQESYGMLIGGVLLAGLSFLPVWKDWVWFGFIPLNIAWLVLGGVLLIRGGFVLFKVRKAEKEQTGAGQTESATGGQNEQKNN
jgi:hypothetical protein